VNGLAEGSWVKINKALQTFRTKNIRENKEREKILRPEQV